MDTELHERLIEEIGLMPIAAFAALRAVVELHAPVEDGIAARRWLDCRGCDGGPGAADWPCTTVRTIARELGIEAP